jgi:hypothetical protein
LSAHRVLSWFSGTTQWLQFSVEVKPKLASTVAMAFPSANKR